MPEPALTVDDGALELRLAQKAPISLDVHLICAPGELLALVGPSGSGKSTVLRCIAGLHRPEQGFVRCNGITWYDSRHGVDYRPQRRRVGFVFQNYALFPHLSALDNVMAGLGHLPPAQRGARAHEWLERMHLTGMEQRKPRQLSGGQQQRVAVARALAADPALLLLDEPFSAVDQVTRRKLQLELARLRQHLRIPIVLVTHDLDEARLLADRMTILHRGVTLQSGIPHTLMTRPANAGVARLVGLYNVFEAVLAQTAGTDAPGRLSWRGRELEVAHTGAHPAGTKVCWAIPSEFVILHRRDRPSRGERENPIEGTVAECVTLGETTSITVHVDGDGATPLSFSVPTHVARRNNVARDERVRVSLLSEGIHLMPWEDNAARG
jgi:molybdate transport system ATP-binding protein